MNSGKYYCKEVLYSQTHTLHVHDHSCTAFPKLAGTTSGVFDKVTDYMYVYMPSLLPTPPPSPSPPSLPTTPLLPSFSHSSLPLLLVCHIPHPWLVIHWDSCTSHPCTCICGRHTLTHTHTHIPHIPTLILTHTHTQMR